MGWLSNQSAGAFGEGQNSGDRDDASLNREEALQSLAVSTARRRRSYTMPPARTQS